MTSPRDGSTRRALLWSIAEKLTVPVLQFGVSIYLARTLAPEDFGLIGMMAIFLALGNVISEAGLGTALVQKKDLPASQASTGFLVSCALGLLISGLIFLCAPAIAAFYREPNLVPVARTLALIPILSSLAVLPTVELTRHLRFKKQFHVGILSVIVGGVSGVAAASQGMGVWSLVFQTLGSQVSRCSGLWLISGWRPKRPARLAKLKDTLKFGGHILGAGIMNSMFDQIYASVIGRWYSAADVGYYTRAYALQQLPASNVATAIGRVMLPALSRVGDDRRKIYSHIKLITIWTMAIHWPVMILLATFARPVILILLGDKWLPSAPYLQLLSVVGALLPVQVILVNVILARARGKEFLLAEVCKKLVQLICLFAGMFWGVYGIVAGQTFAAIIGVFINLYYATLALRPLPTTQESQ